ncbi:MAG: hypothetical protein HN842_00175 [Gammaproteobacteria bacterium]|jgi:hypothetical protein|nr:hypothetical protein [Gammaproteobacteria bacterium]MBT7306596.1 hypothetical protein [Gammaproteobacteria bacterium]
MSHSVTVIGRDHQGVRRATGYFLGGGAIALAAVVMTTSTLPGELIDRGLQLFSQLFVGLLAALVFLSLYSWVRLIYGDRREQLLWLQSGVQSANGITTLALTYTLYGISLGIGSLAGESLTPETIQQVIQSLTDHFSMAFMTTVVGLPLSALLRSLLLVSYERHRSTIIEQGNLQGELE